MNSTLRRSKARLYEQNGVLKAGLVFLVRADKPTLAKMTGTVSGSIGSDKTLSDRTLTVTPLHTLQLDMISKFYQYIQLAMTDPLTDGDVIWQIVQPVTSWKIWRLWDRNYLYKAQQ